MMREDIKSKDSLRTLCHIIVFYYTNSVLFRVAFIGFGRYHLWLWLLSTISFAVSSHVLHGVMFKNKGHHTSERLPTEMTLGMAISAVLISGMTYVIAYCPWEVREELSSSSGKFNIFVFIFILLGYVIVFRLVKFIMTNQELSRDSFVLQKMQEMMRKWGILLLAFIITNSFLLAFSLDTNFFDGIAKTAGASLFMSFALLLLGWASITMLCGIEKR